MLNKTFLRIAGGRLLSGKQPKTLEPRALEVQPRPLVLAIRALLASGLALASGISLAHAELPVPTHSFHLSGIPVDIATQGHATAAVSGNTMTIGQTTDKASIDWQSFNIGAGESVRFEQPSSTSVALNNIHQGDASRILGSLTANGQVYLVNQNGFVFGPNSQVNVNSLVATTLGVSDATFQNGLTNAFDTNGSAALQGNGQIFLKDPQGNYIHDQSGNKVKIQIFIEKGADIQTNAAGGRVIIAAPIINNAGTITTPDGQTILAAAEDKVYLQEANSSSGIRGLLVEVGTGGEVNNMGAVLAERGNASLMGFAVNQNGMVSASTSVSLNGSVRLLASDGIQDPTSTGGKLLPGSTIRAKALDDGLGTKATVNLGAGSVTQVALDADKTTTAIDAQVQNRSQIEISGHDVYLHKGSTVLAHSGNIGITAIDNPSDSSQKGDARIFLESGSLVDASGLKNVSVPVTQNIVSVQLLSNELRDAPLQRTGVLYGQTVSVDLREATLTYNSDGTLASATIPIADLTGAAQRIARNIDERSTSGGTVNLQSSGDVISQSGSKIDFSGGSIAYQGGYVSTTKLVANGSVYDIALADPNLHYDSILGLVSESHPKWGVTDTWTIPGLSSSYFEDGYIQGKAAGTLNISTYEALLNGSLDGSTVAGTYQRPADVSAAGSAFTLNLSNNNLFGSQDIVFNQSEKLVDISYNQALPRKTPSSSEAAALNLAANLFKRSGIANVNIKTNGTISLQTGASLALPTNGSLNLSASGFDIQGSIIAPSGKVSLSPISASGVPLPTSITLGGSALIDVSGLWVNDVLDDQFGHALGTIASNGGSVSLVSEQGNLTLAKGSRIDASAGAWMNTQGKISAGTGGSISLMAASTQSGGSSSSLILDGSLAAWGINEGGSLSLSTNEVIIGKTSDAPVHLGGTNTPLILAPDFFQQGGFANYSITSNVYGLKVANHVTLRPQQKNLLLASNAESQASGGKLENFSTIATLPNTERNPTNLTLTFAELLDQNRSQALTIGQGALIQTDAGGAVTLASDTSIFVNGTIDAPGGAIAATINTPSGVDKGFYASQGIWLGADSRLLAQGVFKPTLNNYGLKTGNVLSGGTINLTANRGYIVGRTGSIINASGSVANLDFQQTNQDGTQIKTVSEAIASSGGSISLAAGEGLLVDSTLLAKSGGAGVAGGTLNVQLDRALRNKPPLTISGGLFPDDLNPALPSTIEIFANNHSAVPNNLRQGGNISTKADNGRAFFTEKQLNKGGFASLSLTTDPLASNGHYAGSIHFYGNVALSAGQQIILDSPTLASDGGQVTLDSAYIRLGSSQSRIDTDLGNGAFSSTLAPAAKTGVGKLVANAQGIDLIGGLSFNGINNVMLASQGDIRTVGIRIRSDTKNYLGQLNLAGDLTLKASQVYPATLTDYKIALSNNPNNTLTILKSGGSPGAVYSADGNLTLSAPNILQQGVLKVPFGSLTLAASKQLTLAAGSLTSVSGDGLTVLFGQGSNGLNWLYPLDTTDSTNIVIDASPAKALTLNGKQLALNSGARIDLQGGGNLYAYEFITGPGGSNDVLNALYSNEFAIIPSLGHSLTPYDPQQSALSGMNLTVGQSIYLDAGAGVAAGWYTILPAHYALLPGAYLITPQSGSQDMQPGVTTTNTAGTTIVAGRYGIASAGTANSRWQGFAVEAGGIARTRSQYTDYYANSFFPTQAAANGSVAANLPQDGGSLTITAQTGLSLGAELLAAPASGGRGGQVDISANNLAIVGRRDELAASKPGTVSLLASDLNKLNAPSLLLGGVRGKTKTGQRVTVSAQTLSIGSDVTLKGSELLLAAQDSLLIKSGAAVESTGKNANSGTNLMVSNQGQSNGDGALVLLSDSGLASVTRAGTVDGTTGTLSVQHGALLKSDNSMLLDATHNSVFKGTIDMQGGSLALIANKISLGNAPINGSGLALSGSLLNLAELSLTSSSNINIYGGVNINTSLLALNAAQINGFDNAGATVALTANTIELTNTGAKAGSVGNGSGSLSLNAAQIQLGSGNYAINGFAKVNLNATESIIGLGQTLAATTGQSSLALPGNLTVAGNLLLNAGYLAGAAGATTSIDATGHQVDITALGAANPAWTGGLGASLSITGDSITSNGRFDLPSGILKLKALNGNINLASGSRIDVSGQAVTFANLTKYAFAGNVSLTAVQGDINLSSGASIDLAGASAGGQQASNAGILAINTAQGQFYWNGAIDATGHVTANSQLNQGQFDLVANTFGGGGFSALNSKLAAAGFTQTVSLEQLTGNATVAATDIVNAHQFSLLADQGGVTINGLINASGSQAGGVSVYGHNGIVLGATGKIIATASTVGATGGSVTLDTVHRDNTGSGLLDLSQIGGVINVSGGGHGMGGTVHLRTGRNDTLDTVNITAIHTHIIGADAAHTALEATRVYAGQTVIQASDITNWQNDTSNFMAVAPALANFSGTVIDLLPGIEIRSTGNLTLASPWDFMGWRYADRQGQTILPGFLTLRADGNLNINATLTDAFAITQNLFGTSLDTLQAGRSWSYDLIAGGNVNLANSYIDPNSGSTAQVMVRTGTGNIDISAGKNIQFIGDPNDPTAAAAVYTMGTTAEYTLSQLLAGQVPGIPVKPASESAADYLNSLNPQQMNRLLRYGYFNDILLGLYFMMAEYPTQGGSINLQAGGNINGINTGQEISSWLVRSGVVSVDNRPTAWGINVTGGNRYTSGNNHYFNQNVGALGGGDVTVTAGGNVNNLSTMLPSTGKPFGQLSATVKNQWTATSTIINGGGNLQITAGNNIVGGEYYVGRGMATINAGGSVSNAGNGLGAIVELGNASVNIVARQNVDIASAFNPTILAQTVLPTSNQGDSMFFTYTDSSAVNFTSVAGNVVLENNINGIRSSKNLDTSNSSGFEYTVYPATLRAVALSGDIRIDNSLTMMPSAQGKLELLAYRNIGTDANAAQLININMSDADPTLLPSMDAPVQQLEGSLSDGIIRTQERLDAGSPQPVLIHAATPLHTGDTSKPSIIAKLGDIAFSSNSQVTFYLPQASEFIAGRDIKNLNLSGQNLSPSDVTQVIAGRDITFDALINSDGIIQANDKQIELGGSGQLQIQAGRNIDLGGSSGINTVGNTINTALSPNGASIDVLAGVAGQPNYTGFINKYFTLGSSYLDNLQILDANGNNLAAGLSPAQKLKFMEQLPDTRKQGLVLAVLANEIKLSSSAAAAAPATQRKALYQQGFDAIATLFPGSKYQGDLSLVFSQIKTLAGGSINLATPGGAVNVGLAGTVGGISKTVDELGIIVQQAGDLNAISQGDFNVNQSRVFTMGGGDIAIWSSQGNIDAGKGAKSAISAPAPITSIDSKGNIVTIFPPIVSGSGIQTINPQDSNIKQGNVYLAAPSGVVDAGEAGISGGHVVIAATAVVGASNISSTNGSVGVPTAVTTPVVPMGAANAAANAAKQATAANEDETSQNSDADKKKSTVSVLSADIVGFGHCSVADVREGKQGCGS